MPDAKVAYKAAGHFPRGCLQLICTISKKNVWFMRFCKTTPHDANCNYLDYRAAVCAIKLV